MNYRGPRLAVILIQTNFYFSARLAPDKGDVPEGQVVRIKKPLQQHGTVFYMNPTLRTLWTLQTLDFLPVFYEIQGDPDIAPHNILHRHSAQEVITGRDCEAADQEDAQTEDVVF